MEKLGKCPIAKSYYDLDILKSAIRPVDRKYEFYRYHNPNLVKYYKKNSGLTQFNNITLQLVLDFKSAAKSYIQELISNVSDYGILFQLNKSSAFNTLHVDYDSFPLIHLPEKKFIIQEIQNIAVQFYADKQSKEFHITMTELIYFFALLVNSDYNWIVMDYLSGINRFYSFIISTDTYNHCSQGKNY